MENILTNYKNAGYLDIKIVNGEELYYLKTPCRFRIAETIVANIRKNYQLNEEIGGVLWAKPEIQSDEVIHFVDNISYIRNAIEDKQRTDGRNKSNAYLSDNNKLNEELKTGFSKGYLPVNFHTNPVKGSSFLHSITYPDLVTETSGQDRKESTLPHTVNGKKLLMPRALIVGNEIADKDIFIGVYNGFISPNEFETSKKKVREENLQKQQI